MSDNQPRLIPLPKFKLMPLLPESKFQGSYDDVGLNDFDQFDDKQRVDLS